VTYVLYTTHSAARLPTRANDIFIRRLNNNASVIKDIDKEISREQKKSLNITPTLTKTNKDN